MAKGKDKKTAVSSKFLGKIRTPKGKASWIYLDTPNENLNGESEYKITLFFDKADPEVKTFIEKLNSFRKEAARITDVPAKNIASPIKKVTEKEKEQVADRFEVSIGSPFIELKTKADGDREIKVVGADAKTEIDSKVWAGSVCRASSGAAVWQFGGKTGLKLYLNAVQVLELVTGGGGDGLDVFEDESSEFDMPESDSEDLGEEDLGEEDLEEEDFDAEDDLV